MALSDIGIGIFIEKFKINLDDVKCWKCDNKACIISNGILYESFPTINSWCVECFMKRDFDSMVTSQVRPSEHRVYDLISKTSHNVDHMKALIRRSNFPIHTVEPTYNFTPMVQVEFKAMRTHSHN